MQKKLLQRAAGWALISLSVRDDRQRGSRLVHTGMCGT